MRPRRKQKIKWSPKIAYAVGLITTDGNLSIDGRHINLTSKDIQLLNVFKKCLDLNAKIGTKGSGFSNKKYYYIQFGDIVFYKWLLQIGLTPNKSKTISGLKIPNRYFLDFLRGCFDGDGSCCSYWDKRWKSSFLFYIYFYSGSLTFIKWLRDKLKKLLNVRGAVSKEYRVWRLKYAKKESKILFSKMYPKRRGLPCLERKHKKLKIIMETDNKNR